MPMPAGPANQSKLRRFVRLNINLLGWVTSTLMWLVYRAQPALARNRLAKMNFFLFQLSLPPMAIGLSLLLLGVTSPLLEPVMAISPMLLWLGALCFAINVWHCGTNDVSANPG